MAWNRGTSESKQFEKPQPGGIRVAYFLGSIVVVGAVGAWWFLSSDKEVSSRPKAESPKQKIQEVAPQPLKKATPQAAVEELVPEKKSWWETDKTNGFSEVEMRVWRSHNGPPPSYVARRKNRSKAAFAIFDYRSENLIASYLCHEAGLGAIGSPNLDGIQEDFMESLKHPIIPTSDDSDEVAELKRLMNQTKIDIKDRLDKGEKLSDILLETHREVQRLGQLKQLIAETLDQQIPADATEEEVKDFVNAAHKMLEDKGIAPLEAGPIIQRKLILDYSEERDASYDKE